MNSRFFMGELEREAFQRGIASRDAEVAAKDARIAELEAARDEWADRWLKVRRELAEIKFPGLTNEVHAAKALGDNDGT